MPAGMSSPPLGIESRRAEAAADALERRLREIGTPERAAGAQRYLKSDLEFLGATVPEIRRELRATTKAFGEITHPELVTLAEVLWSRPIHERRLAAVLLLARHAKLVGPDDLDLLLRLVRESRTWAYVDGLAGDAVGTLVLRHPNAAAALDAWARDDDFWVRRSALLAQLRPLRAGAELDRFGRYADAMLDEREFFIRKAIGWVLRETGKIRPDEVFAWLLPRAARASGVTIREAVKYLTPEHREALRRAGG
jgi:3-methyladenine DNA glycosylase AlkD